MIFIFFHSKSFAGICFWSSRNDGKRKTFNHERKHTVPQSLQSARLCLFFLEHREKQSTRIFLKTIANVRYICVTFQPNNGQTLSLTSRALDVGDDSDDVNILLHHVCGPGSSFQKPNGFFLSFFFLFHKCEALSTVCFLLTCTEWGCLKALTALLNFHEVQTCCSSPWHQANYVAFTFRSNCCVHSL